MKLPMFSRKFTPLAALALAALLGAAAPAVRAQPAPGGPPPHPREGLPFMGDDLMMLAAREMHTAQLVKGAPYCADAVTEHLQTLADGNHIRRTTTVRLCRDADGRTRYETQRPGPGGEVQRVFIHDPIAHVSWLLLPTEKVALKLPGFDATLPRGHAGGLREYAHRMREWVQQLGAKLRGAPAPAAASAPGAPGNGQETVVINGKGDTPVHMQVMRLGNDSPVPLPPQFGPLMLPHGQGEVTSLGSKDIDGLRADGTRTTWTIPAGRIGNDLPIVITHEVWKSPDLLVTVASRHVDPRRGENSYRLSNVTRSEPSADLFKVPADYTVRDMPPPHWRGGPPRGPRPPGSAPEPR